MRSYFVLLNLVYHFCQVPKQQLSTFADRPHHQTFTPHQVDLLAFHPFQNLLDFEIFVHYHNLYPIC